MAESAKKARKVFTALLLAIVIALLIGCGILFNQQRKLKTKLSELESTTEKVAFNLDSITQKSKADELFINEEFKEAWEAYEAIPNTDGRELIASRKEELAKRRARRASLEQNAQYLEASAEEREKLMDIRLSTAEINFQNKLDSTQNQLNTQIGELQSQLAQKEAELAQVPELSRLEFYNSRGTKINYFGEVKSGKANGEGIGVYATGSVYDGDWKDNQKHGKGTYTWDEGEVYEGQFVEDSREGKGTYYWTNGDRYTGSWKGDRRNGIGTLYNKDNEVVLEGNWKNDEFVTSLN
ncbi:MAG: hypothetical protein ABR574_06005 [Cryomorphaceae bacterium]|nr:hypothetical protein [Flavobacteriales bacterium]